MKLEVGDKVYRLDGIYGGTIGTVISVSPIEISYPSNHVNHAAVTVVYSHIHIRTGFINLSSESPLLRLIYDL